MHTLELDTKKGHAITATLYEVKDCKNVLIIASATGVKQGFYSKFASFISSHGITVITFDYLGIGLSRKQSIKHFKNNAADWGRHDLDAIIRFAKEKYRDAPLTLLGHSIGGQLVGLAPSSTEISKLILVAAQSGYWKFWRGTDRAKMWFNWHLLFPAMLGIFGYMPSKKISGMEDLPKNVATQWSDWGKKPNYLFDELHDEELFFNRITARTTSISIQNDFYAPQPSVDWLSQKFSKADVERLHLIPHEFDVKDIGHFGIFRERFKHNIWPLLLQRMK